MIKKLVKIFVVAITFIAMNISLYSDSLGEYLGTGLCGHSSRGYEIWIRYYQFGMVTSCVEFEDGNVLYQYGSEDLTDICKKGNYETIANNEVTKFDEKVYVDLYEANNIANACSVQHKILNKGEEFNIQNLNLEKGKLYIIVLRDEIGAVLMVKKIMPSE
jgi:hypothetical protein